MLRGEFIVWAAMKQENEERRQRRAPHEAHDDGLDIGSGPPRFPSTNGRHQAEVPTPHARRAQMAHCEAPFERDRVKRTDARFSNRRCPIFMAALMKQSPIALHTHAAVDEGPSET